MQCAQYLINKKQWGRIVVIVLYVVIKNEKHGMLQNRFSDLVIINIERPIVN